MILPVFELGSPALAAATLRQPLDELAAAARLVGRIAVRDLTGDHADVVLRLVKAAPGVTRVDGVATPDAAVALLDAGAPVVAIELDTLLADPAGWSSLPKERLWARVSVAAGESLDAKVAPVASCVSGYHFVYADKPDLAALGVFAKALGYHKVSASGSIATAAEVGALDKAGVAAAVGSALLDGSLSLADAIAGCLKTDRTDGLWSTVIVDENGVAVGFAYSDIESLRTAISQKVGAYHSRSRNQLWIKGATSGATQTLLGVALDCDRDALRFTVRQQEPGFCHENTWSCWGPTGGLPALARLLESRAKSAPAGSYTQRLFNDPVLLASKLREEAGELIDASAQNDRDEVIWEAADVMYFTLVHLAKHGISLAEVERHLDAKHCKVTRRKGDAKPGK